MTHGDTRLSTRHGALALGRTPVVMGILNVTPDSFSDGGDNVDTHMARARARLMVAEGADIVDVGGESTRPGAGEVSAQGELDRIMPVLDALSSDELGVPLSIDTYKAVVADQAIQAGASIINDVRGAQRDPQIADVAALYGAPLIAMHWDPHRDPDKDLLAEMIRFFERTLAICQAAGVGDRQVVLDPGFGFGKTYEENYALLHRLGELHVLGCPLLVGTSRKSMIGKVLGVTPKERVHGTVATSVMAYMAGAHIFRVHDVRANREGLAVAAAALYGPPPALE